MGSHAPPGRHQAAGLPAAPVMILGDWRVSHTEVYLGHSRDLSAVLDSSTDPRVQYSPAVLQATLLLLVTLMSVVTVATVASCWGWLRGGKPKRKEQLSVRLLVALSLCAESWSKYAFPGY